jgi:hypothetical protein
MGRGMLALLNNLHKKTGASRPLRGLLVLGLLLLLLASAAPAVDRWYQGWLARSMSAQIMPTDIIQARLIVRQMAALGLPAIHPLVELAASPHATPALFAQQALDELLATWKIEARLDSNRNKFSQHLEILIAALADHVNQLSPAGKTWAEQLAHNVLLQSEHASPRQTARILADCQRVLAAIPPRESQLPHTAQANERPGPPPKKPVRPASDLRVLTVTSQEPDNQKPNIPLKSNRPSKTEEVKTGSEVKRGPEIFSRNGPKVDQEPEALSRISPEHAVAKRLPFPGPSASLHPVIDVPSPDAMAAMRKKYQSMGSRELFILLAGSQGYQAKMIRDVAHNRGISDVELALAPSLASSETTMRHKLLEDISALPATSARRWLHWLLEDSDAQIRLGALTRMATSGDPRLYELAHDRALQDSDSRVAALATQIIQVK